MIGTLEFHHQYMCSNIIYLRSILYNLSEIHYFPYSQTCGFNRSLVCETKLGHLEETHTVIGRTPQIYHRRTGLNLGYSNSEATLCQWATIVLGLLMIHFHIIQMFDNCHCATLLCMHLKAYIRFFFSSTQLKQIPICSLMFSHFISVICILPKLAQLKSLSPLPNSPFLMTLVLFNIY